MTTARRAELQFNPREIEPRWQRRWERDGIYRVREDDPRPRWYELTMYPYPSGDLHIGHWFAMAPADAHARVRRMQGYNVLHPMGFDAFGLPAENAAIKHGVHPREWTRRNIDNMRQQLRSMGPCYDWDREIICALPDYYRWNQWFFLRLYRAGLAYRATAPANWCPECQTVLANEQVREGDCERCGSRVERRDLEQWFLRITRYADELLDFSGLQWPEKILTMQRNWIGRSEGVEVQFQVSGPGLEHHVLPAFTTRVDTLFGATFMVLSPEHPLAERLTAPDRRSEVEAYRVEAGRRSELERISTEREKTGVFLGTHCVNPASGEKLPIFVGDYVLMTYGTGAVMGVPAHDQRDFVFARRYGLPVRVVVAPPGWDGEPLESAYTGEGTMVNSGFATGLPSDRGAEAIADRLEGQKAGRRTVSYRLRDWLISRQRYWGTPIPMVDCSACGTAPVPEEELPVLLPEAAEFRPTGDSPLRRHEGFLHTSCPRCGGPAERETDTMDTFVDSSWYFLRYTSPGERDRPFDPERAHRWCPVDQYTGGAEHAVMHLLYARFFTKALRDLGLVRFGEPFTRLLNQGTIVAESQKMSKSRGNVIAPDRYVEELGADVVRTYLMFLGPWEHGGEWSDAGINGLARWLNRVWVLCLRDAPEREKTSPEALSSLRRLTHRTIRRVTADLESFRFNTALAALMEFTNDLNRLPEETAHTASQTGDGWEEAWSTAIESLLLLLAPMAPHIAEELWERTGRPYSIHQRRLPEWREELAREEEVTLVVQVNGRVRDRLQVPVDIQEERARELALERPAVRRHIDEQPIRKVVYVPGRLLNVVAG